MSELKKRQRELLDRVVAALDAHGAKPPPPRDLARELCVPTQAVIAILELGLEAGDLVRLSNGFHFAPQTLAAIASATAERFKGQAFGTAEIRDLLGVSREIANAVLEHWDASGLTEKQGGQRRFHPSE